MVTTQGRPRCHENRAQEVDQIYISVFQKKSLFSANDQFWSENIATS